MKSVQELQAIRERTQDQLAMRSSENSTRIVVGMATCGIAAGARPVMLELTQEVTRRGLKDVTVAQTGCIGLCQYEPIVEVFRPNEEKVTYVKVNPEMVGRIVSEHIVNGRVVSEYTVGNL